jgi:hypothetical protein
MAAKKKPAPKKKAKTVKNKLKPQQELFCKYYASDREFFGNGLQSYAEAYDIDLSTKGGVNTAKANAYRLLTTDYILNRINELFEANGLNDTFVDKQLEKLIIQDADFKSKVQAIKEYNALKQRVVKKAEVKVGFTMADLLDEINGGEE